MIHALFVQIQGGSDCDADPPSARSVLASVQELQGPWTVAGLPGKLLPGTYRLRPGGAAPDAGWEACACLGWALQQYRFERYRSAGATPRVLRVIDTPDAREALRLASAIYFARDLINMPADVLTPNRLAAEAVAMSSQHPGAQVRVLAGEELLYRGESYFPLVHAVGRAAAQPPHVVDIRWRPGGSEQDVARSPANELPRLTLVGKGVTFDSGGLDLKPAAGMRLMKKDMGGAALVLALAHLVMAAQLPVQLRVLVPCAENAIGPDAIRPGDVLRSRAGQSVECANTDAEGRLLLADALAAAGESVNDSGDAVVGAADKDAPVVDHLVIDAATLTGAARVALGAAIPAFFTADEGLASELAAASAAEHDPVWRLPLYAPYARALRASPVADLTSCPEGGLAGAITAALFLQEFAPRGATWCHLDTMAWNPKSEPGRPEGGEANGLRALWTLLKQRYPPLAT